MIKIDLFVENYLNLFTKKINSLLESFSSTDLEIRGPTFRKRSNNLTVSYNLIPQKNTLESVWTSLANELENLFDELSKKGEVISYSAQNGSIKDQGTEYFKVLQAKLFECYIYEPESFIYARLLHEYDNLKKKEWISIDIDAIEKSAWFEE